MDFLFITTQELSALMDLPWIQRVTYLMGIRPYMDRQTCIVGIKRRISYQSLREVLYVAPIAGVKTGYPSVQQIRRAIKSLERAGLLTVQSADKQLIVKCLLANSHKSVQNKADSWPASQAGINNNTEMLDPCGLEDVNAIQADRSHSHQADIPHNSENNCVFLRQQFEKFWSLYPLRQDKQKAWMAFQQLNPGHDLFEQIMAALELQVAHYQQMEQSGRWVPHWKYPVNWLQQQCWNEELVTYMERKNASHQRCVTKKSSFDVFWESCKDGADYALADEAGEPAESGVNVFTFPTVIKQ